LISKFAGKNYKAFKTFELDLRPITILLGANSSGKSALINSLLMLSQSADSLSISESPLRLNGSKTGMGETLNIIKDKNPANKLTFSFTFAQKDELRKKISHVKSVCMQDHDTVIRFMTHLLQLTGSEASTFNKLVAKIDSLTLRSREPAASIQKTKQFCGLYTKLIKTYRANISSDKKMRHLSEDFIAFTEQTSIQKIEDCFLSFLALPTSKIYPAKIDYSFSYNKRGECLQISEYTQYNKANGVIFHFKKEGNNLNISSDVIDQAALNRSKSEIIKFLTLDSLEFAKPNAPLIAGFGSFTSFKGSTSPFAAMIAQFLNMSSTHLLSSLADLQINHVSPLRAFPQRYYLLDKSIHHRKLNALDGTELAEVLKNNPTIKDNINILFAPYNIGIDIEKVNDIIYKIVVNQDNVNLELTDVGFGISQVLPILVQAYLSPPESLTIIEQPEIHLHPNMQAWLTDAIISIALNENKRFLIETHSDALIRRVRLRIVDESSKLSEEDVKIYHLHRDKINKCTVLDEIEVNDNGDIKWPKDFMDVEIKDTIQIQQLKYEKIKKDSGAALQ
jgi:AAA15 family ATPase/GTPase